MGTPGFTPWPCTMLTQYPLDKTWNDSFPLSRLPKLHYVSTKQIIYSFYLTKQYLDTYSELRDYAWQQGASSNANSLDREFFNDVLTHDYPFLIGHQQQEIQSGFQIDREKYKGIDHLRASHFDLYRVERAGLGLTELKSLLHPGIIRAFISFSECPNVGDYVFARLLPVGLMPRSLAYTVTEPWDTVSPKHIDRILEICRRQYNAFKDKFPEADERAFMKVAAYHVYELIQSFELIDMLNDKLKGAEDNVEGVTYSLIFPDKSKMPKPAECPHAIPVKEDGEIIKDLATAPLSENSNLPATLSEAIISQENRTLEITTFMRKAGKKYVEGFIESLPARTKIIRKEKYLDNSELYRALRHIYIYKN